MLNKLSICWATTMGFRQSTTKCIKNAIKHALLVWGKFTTKQRKTMASQQSRVCTAWARPPTHPHAEQQIETRRKKCCTCITKWPNTEFTIAFNELCDFFGNARILDAVPELTEITHTSIWVALPCSRRITELNLRVSLSWECQIQRKAQPIRIIQSLFSLFCPSLKPRGSYLGPQAFSGCTQSHLWLLWLLF